MWLEKINNKELRMFVFGRLPLPFLAILFYACGSIHGTLALWWALSGLLLIGLPTKIGWLIAKALFPSLPARCDVWPWRWGWVVWLGLWPILTILFNILLYYHVGIPEWALLIDGIDHPPWRKGFFITGLIALLTAEFATALSFAWRLQKKKRE